MALGTTSGHAHPHLHRRVHAIHHCGDPEFLVVGSPLCIGHRIAVEGSGQQLFLRRIRQHVSRQLFDRKLIECQISIDRLYHPVAKRPNRPCLVTFITIGIGEARFIKPVPCPAFSKMGRMQ